jgi:hypothetical protein
MREESTESDHRQLTRLTTGSKITDYRHLIILNILMRVAQGKSRSSLAPVTGLAAIASKGVAPE